MLDSERLKTQETIKMLKKNDRVVYVGKDQETTMTAERDGCIANYCHIASLRLGRAGTVQDDESGSGVWVVFDHEPWWWFFPKDSVEIELASDKFCAIRLLERFTTEKQGDKVWVKMPAFDAGEYSWDRSLKGFMANCVVRGW
jgi:hypothetical protein